MKKRKLWNAGMMGVLSAAMLMTNVSVWGAEFGDGAKAQAVEAQTLSEEPEFAAEEASEGRASEIAINSTNFPDSKFRSFVLENIDTDKNKTLSSAEIKAVTSLNVNGLGIKNLKGVERFTYLTELYAANNALTSIDLTKNTKITKLNLDSNKLKTLDLSKITAYVETLKYSNNQLTKVTMPARKYLSKIDYINASHNKFTTQAAAGLNISSGDELDNLSEIDASYNSIATFSCSGFGGKIDLSNNKLTTLKEGSLGFKASALYLEGKYNTLSKTSKVDFGPMWNDIPQEFSCNSAVKSKIVMAAPRLSIATDWDKITVKIGSSKNDAPDADKISYTLYRKTGSGSYSKVKTWPAGYMDGADVDDNQYVDTNVKPGTDYTYKLTASVSVQDRNKKLQTWSNSVEKKAGAYPAVTTVSPKSTKKGYASVSWKAVPGASGYAVYYGSSASSAKTALTKATTKTSVSKKLTSGKTYYFRVRAYKDVNGKRVYAPFCTAKGVKIK